MLALTTGAVLLGVVGVSLAVSDQGASVGHSAQAPIGEISAGSLGESDSGGTKGGSNSGSNGDVEGGSDSGSSHGSDPSAVKASGGSGDGGNSLPFTGFLAIPVLLVGLALLGAGFALRRRDALPSRS